MELRVKAPSQLSYPASSLITHRAPATAACLHLQSTISLNLFPSLSGNLNLFRDNPRPHQLHQPPPSLITLSPYMIIITIVNYLNKVWLLS